MRTMDIQTMACLAAAELDFKWSVIAVIFILAAIIIGALALKKGAKNPPIELNPIARAAQFVNSAAKWDAGNFYEFLAAIPPDAMLNLKKGIGLLDPMAVESQLNGPERDAREVQKQTLRLSSHFITYPFSDEKQVDYHEITKWVCRKAGVPSKVLEQASTFTLERELQNLLFEKMWDKLTPEQREELLAKVDPSGTIKNATAIAALGGAGALTALSTTVAFTGFAFYTTMSSTIAMLAGSLGVTLPFTAYAGASTIVAVLSGPVGLAVIGAMAIGGIALAGGPDLQKTTTLICQVHALKIEALEAAGLLDL